MADDRAKLRRQLQRHGARRRQALDVADQALQDIAELLRGDYKQSEYGRVILPLVVMRRLDQALDPTKQAVLDKVADLERRGIENMDRPLRGAAGLQFFNRSPLSFPQLLNDPGQIAVNDRTQAAVWAVRKGIA